MSTPKLRCPVCGPTTGWLRTQFNPKGEWICDDCGCFCSVVKPKVKKVR